MRLQFRFIWQGGFALFIMMAFAQPLQTTAQDNTPTPEPQAIRVWWPEALYPSNNPQAIDQLFANFNDSNIVQITPRIYMSNFNGQNVIAQLNLTLAVAPDAMPDIVLMRRDDMISAVLATNNLPPSEEDRFQIRPIQLQVIEGWNTRPILNEMLPLSSALQVLGEVNGVLYGLPYLADIQHMIAAPDTFEENPSNFGDVIEAGIPIHFPGRPRTGQAVNDMVLALYISYGGHLVDSANLPMLDDAALESTLQLVKSAVDSNVISSNLSVYRSPNDYLQDILNNQANFALVTSNTYLSNDSLNEYRVLSIPPADRRVVFVDGWVWVLLSNDPERQSDAREFVGWMMETDQIIDAAELLNYVPLQERALNAMDDVYFEIAEELFAATTFVEGRRNQAALALQSAFDAILNGADVEEAANTARGILAPEDTDAP